jgi:oligopeptide/dipeptide ABC transporter ATP-binding protein
MTVRAEHADAVAPGPRPAGDRSPVLTVRGLSVDFTTETGRVSAVDGVDLTLGAGEIVGVVGESGCGKSVTSMSLAGLLPSTAEVTGSVVLHQGEEDTELAGAREPVLRRVRGRDIAYIFQEPMTSLNPVVTIGYQVAEVLQAHERVSRREARRRAIELLRLVGIPSADKRADDYPHQLSGGMRQRVMIAMAVACDPTVLVADEPTTALDVTVQAGILQVLRDLRDRLGTSILFITHDLGVIADVADRVVVMYAGRVVEAAPVDDLFARPRHRYTAGLMAASPLPGRHAGSERLDEIPGLVPVLSEQPDACTFADRCGAADELCRSQRPPLAPSGETAPGTGHVAACWHPVPDAAEEAR